MARSRVGIVENEQHKKCFKRSFDLRIRILEYSRRSEWASVGVPHTRIQQKQIEIAEAKMFGRTLKTRIRPCIARRNIVDVRLLLFFPLFLSLWHSCRLNMFTFRFCRFSRSVRKRALKCEFYVSESSEPLPTMSSSSSFSFVAVFRHCIFLLLRLLLILCFA